MPVELQIAFNLIGTTTVVTGFIFATYQFITFRRQRQQEVALTLMRTTAPPETFSRSVRRVFALPDDASADAIHALGPELEQAVIQACVNYENLGYLVNARLIPLRLTDDLFGRHDPVDLAQVPRLPRSVPRRQSLRLRVVRVALRSARAISGAVEDEPRARAHRGWKP